MNDLNKHSQDQSLPEVSDFKKIWDLIIGGSLSTLSSVVQANLFISSMAFDEFEETEQPKQKVESLVKMSINHLLDMKVLVEMACEVRNFIEFRHSISLIDDLVNALNTYIIIDKNHGVIRNTTSCFLCGLHVFSEKIEENINALSDFVYENREVLNG